MEKLPVLLKLPHNRSQTFFSLQKAEYFAKKNLGLGTKMLKLCAIIAGLIISVGFTHSYAIQPLFIQDAQTDFGDSNGGVDVIELNEDDSNTAKSMFVERKRGEVGVERTSTAFNGRSCFRRRHVCK